jgi:hypothetical protein
LSPSSMFQAEDNRPCTCNSEISRHYPLQHPSVVFSTYVVFLGEAILEDKRLLFVWPLSFDLCNTGYRVKSSHQG